MNIKRLVLTILAVFVAANLTGFFIHAIWLAADYVRVAELYRPENEVRMIWINLGYLAFAIGAVWIYARGVENKPWLGQGIRFGIALWLVTAVAYFFIAYAVQPIPTVLMAKQVLYEGINKVLLGILTAALYRP